MKDIDERIIEYRIRQDNRYWVARQIVKAGFFIAGAILFFGYILWK